MSMPKYHKYSQSSTLGWLILLLFFFGVSTEQIVNGASAGRNLDTEEAAFQGHCGHTSPCEQLCYEIHDGIYECDCIEGYELNRNGYSCKVINATINSITGVRGKLDEDVFYEKGAFFSAELASANTQKYISQNPLTNANNGKNYNPNTYSYAEMKNYDFINENQQSEPKVNLKTESHKYYISGKKIYFDLNRLKRNTTNKPNTITRTFEQHSFFNIDPSVTDKNVFEYSAYLSGIKKYGYRSVNSSYASNKQMKVTTKKHRIKNVNTVTNNTQNSNKNANNMKIQTHINPTNFKKYITFVKNLTAGPGNHTKNITSQCKLDCGSDGICASESNFLSTRCLCPFGKGGNQCQDEMRVYVPRFTKRSWMAFPALHGAFKHVELRLEFRPESFDGIILLSGERDDLTGDFMALLLNKGFVEFWFDCGSGVGSVRSRETVSLSEWNSVIIYRHRWDAWLVLNHGTKIQDRSNGLFSRITFREPVFLGGFGNITGISKRLPLAEGFSGCIRRFVANEHDYKFIGHPLGDVSNGFDIQECSTDECVHYPCEHGGKCLQSGQVPVCLCPIGFVGDLCEIRLDLQIPAFNGSSFLRYASLRDSALIWLELKIILKPKQDDGLILYSGPKSVGDFIAVYLKKGFVEFAFDLGSGPALVRSKHTLTIGLWHVIHISRTARLAVLKIDQHQEVMTISSNGFWHLSLEQNLFVGGVSHKNHLPLDMQFLPFFVGCIQNIEINGKTLGIVSEALGGSNLDNCPHACAARPCGSSAECVPRMENYECRCRLLNKQCEAFSGPTRRQSAVYGPQYLFKGVGKVPVSNSKNLRKHGNRRLLKEDNGEDLIKNKNVLNFLKRKKHLKPFGKPRIGKENRKKSISSIYEYSEKANSANFSKLINLPNFQTNSLWTYINKTNELEYADEKAVKAKIQQTQVIEMTNTSTYGETFTFDDSLSSESDHTKVHQRNQFAINMKRITSSSNSDEKKNKFKFQSQGI
ncbi:pikachurin [Drosophila tropicalis]|uniref:pikachurin n=1 Tax=Drosophila tropicalis TaxID=46794 RepID=UPI0035AC151F